MLGEEWLLLEIYVLTPFSERIMLTVLSNYCKLTDKIAVENCLSVLLPSLFICCHILFGPTNVCFPICITMCINFL